MLCGGDSDAEPSGDVPRPEPVRRQWRECGHVCLQEAGHAGAGLGFTLPGR